jgi:transglutaminase-like putative cysteine protease
MTRTQVTDESGRHKWIGIGKALVLAVTLVVSGSQTGWTVVKDEPSTSIPTKPEGMTSRVSFVIRHQLGLSGEITNLRFTLCIPKTIEGRQRVIDLRFSPEPIAVYDDNDNRYAIFSFPKPSGDLEVKISGEIELYRYDIEIAISAATVAGRSPIKLSDSERADALKSEQFLEVDDPVIRKIADPIKSPRERLFGSGLSGEALRNAEIDTIQNILDTVRQRLQYEEYSGGEGASAVLALTRGKGMCQDFANVFVTMCRAKGLPAKAMKGLCTFFESGETASHQWAEVFMSDLGWVPFDPTCMSSASAILRPIYVRESNMATDSRLKIGTGSASWQCSYPSGSPGPKVTLAESYHFYPR